ncbi:hypothetical protein Lser_V15G20073 [Lactuca serriola]
MLDSFVNAHDASISNATSTITASTKVCTEATEKVDKLIQDANIFLESLQGAAELNASKVTSSITNLEKASAAEKQNFATLCQDIQKDNAALLSSLNERFMKLQADLAMENSFMDELALKTTQLKTKNLQLSQVNNEVNQIHSERVVVKSCVSDVHIILSNVLEAHDPILTLSVQRHIADKFCHALGFLSRIEGVLETTVPPKQGSHPEPKKTEHASGSGFKAKGKGTVDDSEEEEETIAEALKRKAREREIDLNAKIVKEAEEKKRILKEAHDLLESKKTLFLFWTLEKLIKEAIESPITHCLDLVVSLDCENTKDFQFDMPITRKVFMFHRFLPIAKVPHPDPKVDHGLIDYYLEVAQPQYLTWSAQKIITVRVLKPQALGKYIHVKFKVTRGSTLSEHTFSLVDLPNLNPHDWIVLHNILLSNPVEYEPMIDHLKRLIVYYILEVPKMDQEIASVLRKKPTILPIGLASDVNKMKMGKIDPVLNFVMFTK